MKTSVIVRELKMHAPFTAFGAATGIILMVIFVTAGVPSSVSTTLFWIFHPFHVFLSALVTAGIYRLHGNKGVWQTLVIGYIGSVGIATLSDSIIPFVGEFLLSMPNRGLHLGVVEKWWLVNPLAAAGIAVAFIRPNTKFPHAGHVLLSTWASLFHITMAMGAGLGLVDTVVVAVFLFFAVWLPCCASDIVFPLLFSRDSSQRRATAS